MSDAPERIWAWPWLDSATSGQWQASMVGEAIEYITRAEADAMVQAERERCRSLVMAEYRHHLDKQSSAGSGALGGLAMIRGMVSEMIHGMVSENMRLLSEKISAGETP